MANKKASKILAAVNCTVDCSNEDKTKANDETRKLLINLGATVSDTFAAGQTHLIWWNGNINIAQAAGFLNIKVVSPLWVEHCKQANKLVDETDFLVNISNFQQKPAVQSAFSTVASPRNKSSVVTKEPDIESSVQQLRSFSSPIFSSSQRDFSSTKPLQQKKVSGDVIADKKPKKALRAVPMQDTVEVEPEEKIRSVEIRLTKQESNLLLAEIEKENELNRVKMNSGKIDKIMIPGYKPISPELRRKLYGKPVGESPVPMKDGKSKANRSNSRCQSADTGRSSRNSSVCSVKRRSERISELYSYESDEDSDSDDSVVTNNSPVRPISAAVAPTVVPTVKVSSNASIMAAREVVVCLSGFGVKPAAVSGGIAKEGSSTAQRAKRLTIEDEQLESELLEREVLSQVLQAMKPEISGVKRGSNQSEDFNILVVPFNNEKKSKKAKRTLKILSALARGIPVLKPSWLYRSLEAGKWLLGLSDIVSECHPDYYTRDVGSRIRVPLTLYENLRVLLSPILDPNPAYISEIITQMSGSMWDGTNLPDLLYVGNTSDAGDILRYCVEVYQFVTKKPKKISIEKSVVSWILKVLSTDVDSLYVLLCLTPSALVSLQKILGKSSSKAGKLENIEQFYASLTVTSFDCDVVVRLIQLFEHECVYSISHIFDSIEQNLLLRSKSYLINIELDEYKLVFDSMRTAKLSSGTVGTTTTTTSVTSAGKNGKHNDDIIIPLVKSKPVQSNIDEVVDDTMSKTIDSKNSGKGTARVVSKANELETVLTGTASKTVISSKKIAKNIATPELELHGRRSSRATPLQDISVATVVLNESAYEPKHSSKWCEFSDSEGDIDITDDDPVYGKKNKFYTPSSKPPDNSRSMNSSRGMSASKSSYGKDSTNSKSLSEIEATASSTSSKKKSKSAQSTPFPIYTPDDDMFVENASDTYVNTAVVGKIPAKIPEKSKGKILKRLSQESDEEFELSQDVNRYQPKKLMKMAYSTLGSQNVTKFLSQSRHSSGTRMCFEPELSPQPLSKRVFSIQAPDSPQW